MNTYNKLVRDNILDIIRTNGEQSIFHIANEEEFKIKLFEKLQEEAVEFIKDEKLSELADLLEVIDAICVLKGFSTDELMEVKNKRKVERGGFEKRIILEQS